MTLGQGLGQNLGQINQRIDELAPEICIRKYMEKVGDYWYYRRGVPKQYRDYDERRHIRKSTKQKDFVLAFEVAKNIHEQTEMFWRTLAHSDGTEDIPSYHEAVEMARILKVDYKAVQDLKVGDIPDVLHRVEIIAKNGLKNNTKAVASLLGGAENSEIKVSELFQQYEFLVKVEHKDKAPDQYRKWKNPKLKAIKNFIKTVDDKKLSQITRSDALSFRAWWADRIENEGMDPGTANKDIGNMQQMFKKVSDMLNLKLDNVFSELRIKGEKHNPRIAYEPEYVRDKILAPGAMGELNKVAQAVVKIVAYTGMRPTEVVNMVDSDIHLDAPIPYISIKPTSRRLKTQHSERDIPLTKPVLEIYKSLPKERFKRYRGNSDSLSGLVNKTFLERGLRPTEGHTLYSLRHTFQDLLIEADCQERVQAELMGHKFHRPKYGSGASLEKKLKWLNEICYSTV